MCACSFDFTCPKCSGTPLDPFYEDDEPILPEPFTAEDA